MSAPLTPEILLRAYAMGAFPMGSSRDDPGVEWVTARLRGVMPLEGLHVSRSLARHIRKVRPRVTVDQAFAEVVRHCADRPETWINAPILAAYQQLHALGHAHSLEVWQGETLAGGIYGVTLGAAFFGESMFSTRANGSKMALAFLVHRLRAGGFRLFDTQFLTAHLASMGAVEIPRAAYEARLAEAIARPARFRPETYPDEVGPEVLQLPPVVVASARAGGASAGAGGASQDKSQTS